MTGVGPEKSFPVMRERVAISEISRYECQCNIRVAKSLPYGRLFFKQYVILAGSLLSSALNLFLHAFLSRPGKMNEISS